jgi:hypothetical protein
MEAGGQKAEGERQRAARGKQAREGARYGRKRGRKELNRNESGKQGRVAILHAAKISRFIAAAGRYLNLANDGKTRDRISEPHEQCNVPVPVWHLWACWSIRVEERGAHG